MISKLSLSSIESGILIPCDKAAKALQLTVQEVWDLIDCGKLTGVIITRQGVHSHYVLKDHVRAYKEIFND